MIQNRLVFTTRDNGGSFDLVTDRVNGCVYKAWVSYGMLHNVTIKRKIEIEEFSVSERANSLEIVRDAFEKLVYIYPYSLPERYKLDARRYLNKLTDFAMSGMDYALIDVNKASYTFVKVDNVYSGFSYNAITRRYAFFLKMGEKLNRDPDHYISSILEKSVLRGYKRYFELMEVQK